MEDVHAELSGSVWKILVSVGDQVEADQEIMILESMKMEIPVVATRTGRVQSIEVSEEAPVDEGDLLARLSDDV